MGERGGQIPTFPSFPRVYVRESAGREPMKSQQKAAQKAALTTPASTRRPASRPLWFLTADGMPFRVLMTTRGWREDEAVYEAREGESKWTRIERSNQSVSPGGPE